MATRVSIGEARLLGLIEATMDVALDRDGWPALLARIADATGGVGAMLAGCNFAQPWRSFNVAVGLDADCNRAFLERHVDNPLARAMLRVPVGQPADTRSLVGRAALERSPFFDEVLRPQRLDGLVAMQLRMGPQLDAGGISIAMPGGHEASARRAIETLAVLAPFLQRAVAASMALGPQAATTSELAAALDAMDTGVLLVDGQARLLHANACAARVLARRDALDLAGGPGAQRLVARRTADTAALHRTIAAAAAAVEGRALPGGDALRLPRCGGAPALEVMAAPVGDLRARCRLAQRPLAMLLVEDPDRAGAPDTVVFARLRELYGLSPAEAAVACRIADGLGLPQAAAALGMATGTAHTHLKHVFDKTGARRQSALAACLQRSGALRSNACIAVAAGPYTDRGARGAVPVRTVAPAPPVPAPGERA